MRLRAIRKILRPVKRAAHGVYYSQTLQNRRNRKSLSNLLHKYYGWGQFDNATSTKVALIVRDGSTYPKSSAFIRLISPLTDPLLKSNLSLQLYPENTTAIPPGTDVCIVQRTAYNTQAQAKNLVSNLAASGTKLVIDTDDSFHHIDPKHPEHNTHRGALEAFDFLIKAADQVWLSTLKLAEYVKTDSAHLIRNSLDNRVWASKPSAQNSGPLQILYMGTVSHDQDFDQILPALERLALKYPKSFHLTMIGATSKIPARRWVSRLYQPRSGSIYPRFVKWFLKQGPFDIGLAPLVDNDFNRSKSDIKCLDYLAAGILPVVSDVEPYKAKELDEFIIRVKNTPRAWEKQLEAILTDVDGFRASKSKIIPKAQKYIWRERSSSKTAAQLWDLLKQLKSN